MGQPIQEPSMEDILASIKRIIAEDGEAAPPPPRVRRGPVAVPDTAIAEPEALREPVEPEPEPEAVPEPEPEPEEAVASEPEPELASDDVPPPEPSDVLELTSPMVAPPGWHPASILSANAEQASRHAFAALAQAKPEEPPRGQTMEAVVTEMLRPMLSDWLDRELPAIVERIVTAEVRRISNRG